MYRRFSDMNSLGDSSPGWWKVIISGGRKHNRDWLLRKLKDLCRVSFHEINYHVVGRDSVFFVNDGSIAGALIDVSNRITTKDGSRIIIRAYATYNTRRTKHLNTNRNVMLNEEQLQQLNFCLGQRYEQLTKKLNLSRLIHDRLLKNARIVGNVTNLSFMNKVLNLMKSVCPDLKILDLSYNDMFRLDSLTHLTEKCPCLVELDLSGNGIRYLDELKKINDHKKIIKLWFQDNPVQRQFTNRNSYSADIRKHLPNLKVLDGVELTSGIMFSLDTENETHLPDRKDVFSTNKNDLDLVKDFVQKYFKYYDDDRLNNGQKLLYAYHHDAMFSLSCNPSVCTAAAFNSLLSTYPSSRNLKIIQNKEKKKSLLLNKKLKIVAFLSELPQTKHWLDSFSLDMTFATSRMLCFTVQGIYLEGKDEIPRGFSRTFIGQRESNTMFLVINDMLTIRNLTDQQLLLLENVKYNNVHTPSTVTVNIRESVTPPVVKETQQDLATKFSKQLKLKENTNNINHAPAKITQAVQTETQDLATIFSEQLKLLESVNNPRDPAEATTHSVIEVEVTHAITETQTKLARRFSVESKMNLKFSRMCLEAANWNYQQAAAKFLELNKKGSIPVEAFVQTIVID